MSRALVGQVEQLNHIWKVRGSHLQSFVKEIGIIRLAFQRSDSCVRSGWEGSEAAGDSELEAPGEKG